MLRLTMLIYTILGVTLAGAAIVFVLTLGRFDLPWILGAAAAGAIAAVPGSWLVAQRLREL